MSAGRQCACPGNWAGGTIGAGYRKLLITTQPRQTEIGMGATAHNSGARSQKRPVIWAAEAGQCGSCESLVGFDGRQVWSCRSPLSGFCGTLALATRPAALHR
ncbi:hypothetical protein MGG_17388 [Pyricularia oryzae 70-15]|uniref:Uncharacterized protein n=4 Tax=Pyricularia oryzae TaxID=318829 RepID=G4NEX8_PYRO7|nr:uncharacterized protein MGG_17388 [Pyricularia oryzae 70-15]ELQ36060.1 hypothetical protein OOU_Y34scaffold00669g45 [Pyricularia oryzae Y34]KAI7928961.1 hypothetical protein M9X92_001540 [Pyricularia oryzae]EHA48704.1 hypothetical protein MGG_17388 [Pyricularia oryzae 70-15]KAI7929633.1 hypothetical protein M0657_002110 [Pyricularia oryzae]QBZ62528.1 hypothetical protein PoMZ_11410 [Pyricularia oryzae]